MGAVRDCIEQVSHSFYSPRETPISQADKLCDLHRQIDACDNVFEVSAGYGSSQRVRRVTQITVCHIAEAGESAARLPVGARLAL